MFNIYIYVYIENLGTHFERWVQKLMHQYRTLLHICTCQNVDAIYIYNVFLSLRMYIHINLCQPIRMLGLPTMAGRRVGD